MPLEVGENNFDQEVKEGLVLVDFWAPWCAPCRMVAPVLEEIEEEMQGKVRILKVNVDENPQLAMRYGITSIPTFLLFKNGELVDRTIGAAPKNHYVDLLQKHL